STCLLGKGWSAHTQFRPRHRAAGSGARVLSRFGRVGRFAPKRRSISTLPKNTACGNPLSCPRLAPYVSLADVVSAVHGQLWIRSTAGSSPRATPADAGIPVPLCIERSDRHAKGHTVRARGVSKDARDGCTAHGASNVGQDDRLAGAGVAWPCAARR